MKSRSRVNASSFASFDKKKTELVHQAHRNVEKSIHRACAPTRAEEDMSIEVASQQSHHNTHCYRWRPSRRTALGMRTLRNHSLPGDPPITGSRVPTTLSLSHVVWPLFLSCGSPAARGTVSQTTPTRRACSRHIVHQQRLVTALDLSGDRLLLSVSRPRGAGRR